jgi:hypothetical protein
MEQSLYLGGNMKVGDLVMWIGKDEHHGDIGVIVKVHQAMVYYEGAYTVQWSDGVVGKEIHPLELMALDNDTER